MNSGYYVYCFIEGDRRKNWGPVGMDGKEVFTVHYNGLAVVVSETDKKIIDPLKKYLLTHQEVVTKVMEEHDPAPVSFGTLIGSRDKLDALMEEMYPRLTEILSRIKNRVELGLKVFWTAESFQAEMEQAGPEISKLKKQIREMSSGDNQKRYSLAVQLGEKVEALANAKREEYTAKIYVPLVEKAVDAKLNEITNEKMIMNASFLVDKDKEKDFDLAVDTIYKQYNKYLDFKYSGPWPAYSFIQTVLKSDV